MATTRGEREGDGYRNSGGETRADPREGLLWRRRWIFPSLCAGAERIEYFHGEPYARRAEDALADTRKRPLTPSLDPFRKHRRGKRKVTGLILLPFNKSNKKRS